MRKFALHQVLSGDLIPVTSSEPCGAPVVIANSLTASEIPSVTGTKRARLRNEPQTPTHEAASLVVGSTLSWTLSLDRSSHVTTTASSKSDTQAHSRRRRSFRTSAAR